MSIEDEASAEAKRRYPATLRYDGDEFPNRDAGALRQGWLERGVWEASRKLGAAPSNTDREALRKAVSLAVYGDEKVTLGTERLVEQLLAAGFTLAQPVQVEVTGDQLIALQDLIDDNAKRSMFESVAVENPREIARLIVRDWLPSVVGGN